MPARTIDVAEAQAHLPELVSLVVVEGTEVILTQGGKDIARLVPIRPGAPHRVPGLHAGTAWMADDFDAPLLIGSEETL